MQYPLGTTERFFAGAAEQHGKTAAPPANARQGVKVDISEFKFAPVV